MTLRVGINGFGRIGRSVLKHLMSRDDVEPAGINDLADVSDLADLLKSDSVHGWSASQVENDDASITVDRLAVPRPPQPPPGTAAQWLHASPRSEWGMVSTGSSLLDDESTLEDEVLSKPDHQANAQQWNGDPLQPSVPITP